ncbi:MAG TPA: tetratricopeptide repeat protein [Gemmataceae bacterium]|nr:tetratricopeptide repeat protein [Gemmataceae bacterium]
MDGRIKLGFFAGALALFSGCVTSSSQNTLPNNSSPNPNDKGGAVSFKTDNEPWKTFPKGKHDASAATEIAFGKMKEIEADSPQYKAHPEAQAKLRDDARKAYQKAVQTDPNNIEAQRHLGRIYVKMGDIDRAQDVYRKALAKHPKEGSLWYDFGLCHTRRAATTKDFTESMRCFNKALELEPENRDYLKMLGMTLAWVGQLDAALSRLSLAQGAPMAHYNIARILEQKDQVELAKQHLRLALRGNAQLEDAREMLARLENPGSTRAMDNVSQNRQ